MINIRPASDLVSKLPEIEETVLKRNSPVFLTKDGYGTMVLMSVEQYSSLVDDDIESKLDEADAAASASNVRLSASDVFASARRRIDEQKRV